MLTEDLKDAAVQAGGPRAGAAFDRSATYYRTVNQRIEDALANVREAVMPEDAYAQAGQKSGMYNPKGGATGVIALKRSLMNSGPQGEAAWNDFVGQQIRDLGMPSPGQTGSFSPSTFLTNLNRLTQNKAAYDALFSGPNMGPVKESMENLRKVAQNMRGAGRFDNPSGTAHASKTLDILQHLGEVGMGALAATVAGGEGLTHILPELAATAGAGLVALPVTANVAQRLITDPKFTRWMATETQGGPTAAERRLIALMNTADPARRDDYKQFVDQYRSNPEYPFQH